MTKELLTMGLLATFVSAFGSLLGCTEKEKAATDDTSLEAAAKTATGSALATMSTTPQNSPAAANDLAWKLFRATCKIKPGNVFMSPASLTTAIGLGFEGSSGATREKLRRFLTLPSSNPDGLLMPSVRESFKNAGSSIKLQMQNAVWVDPAGFDPTPAYTKIADEQYEAKVEKKPFGDGVKLSEEINSWVKSATNGMIDKLVEPGDLRGNHLAVLNAIYFLAAWDEPFDKTRTREGEFKTSSGSKTTVPLMNNARYWPYFETPEYQLVHLPYKNPDFVMSILLPREKVKLEVLEEKLTAGAFEAEGSTENIWVTLPKFEIDWGAHDVLEQLVEVGMPKSGPMSDFKAFGAKQDFIVAAVIHRAVVKVDEVGTEAAAATAMMARAGSAPATPKRFEANRPFLFAIRDVKRNEIIFLGRLSKP